MPFFKDLNTSSPATLEEVVAAVARLSALDEAQIQDFVSSGKFDQAFPFSPRQMEEKAATFMDKEALIRTRKRVNIGPLSMTEKRELIQSSMPASPKSLDTISIKDVEAELAMATLRHYYSNQT